MLVRNLARFGKENKNFPKLLLTHISIRKITLHEYQCADLLKRYNIPMIYVLISYFFAKN